MDRRIREHERAAASGDLHARVRLLQARLQAGTLTEGSLRAAAAVGDEAARVVVGRPRRVTPIGFVRRHPDVIRAAAEAALSEAELDDAQLMSLLAAVAALQGDEWTADRLLSLLEPQACPCCGVASPAAAFLHEDAPLLTESPARRKKAKRSKSKKKRR